MEIVYSLSLPFILGIVFGAGGFYGLTTYRLKNFENKSENLEKKVELKFESFEKKVEQKFECLDKKIDDKFHMVSCDIKMLIEKVSRLEGKQNGKQVKKNNLVDRR